MEKLEASHSYKLKECVHPKVRMHTCRGGGGYFYYEQNFEDIFISAFLSQQKVP